LQYYAGLDGAGDVQQLRDTVPFDALVSMIVDTRAKPVDMGWARHQASVLNALEVN
jgi:hypothetical protein